MQYNGHGFKCPITKIDDKWGIQQTRVCVLDQRMISDSTLDCDDKSDEPKEDQLSVMKYIKLNCRFLKHTYISKVYKAEPI